MNLKTANMFIESETNHELKLQKGKDYFYFMSSTGYTPDSIMTKSIKNITIFDLKNAVDDYNNKKKQENQWKNK